jgi:hypothetical protein
MISSGVQGLVHRPAASSTVKPLTVLLEHVALKRHFKGRLAGAPIKPREYLLHTATFTLDGVPAPAFASFRQSANATRALISEIRGEADALEMSRVRVRGAAK